MKGDGHSGRSMDEGPPTYSKSKPAMEKRRRDRINASLAELRSLIPETRQKLNKMEKADILEMTVKYLRQLQETSGATADKSRATSQSYCLGFNECAQEVSQFFRSRSPFSTRVKCSLLEHLGKCAPCNPPDSPSSSPTKRRTDQHPVSGTLVSSSTPSAPTTTVTSTARVVLGRATTVEDSILSRCLLAGLPASSSSSSSRLPLLQGKESSSTTATTASTSLSSTSSSSFSSSSSSTFSSKITSCHASGRTNVSTPVAVSSTSDEVVSLTQEFADDGDDNDEVDFINNNNCNNNNNNSFTTNNNNISNNNNECNANERSPLVTNERDIENEQRGIRVENSVVLLQCEGQNLNETPLTLGGKFTPNVETVKRDLFGALEETNNNVIFIKRGNDLGVVKPDIYSENITCANSVITSSIQTINNSFQPIVSNIHTMGGKHSKGWRKPEAWLDDKAKSPLLTSPNETSVKRQQPSTLPSSKTEIPSISQIVQDNDASLRQALNENVAVHGNASKIFTSEFTTTKASNSDCGQIPNVSNDDRTLLGVEKGSAYLIPIYIQTSFGQGEIPSFQQAFVINQPTSVPLGSSSSTEITPPQASAFTLAPKLPPNTVQSLTENATNSTLSYLSCESKNLADKEKETFYSEEYIHKHQICNPPSETSAFCPDNSKHSPGESYSEHLPMQCNDMSVGVQKVFTSFSADNAMEVDVTKRTALQTCISLPEGIPESNQTIPFRFHEEDDYPHLSSSLPTRYLTLDSCHTSDDDECHEVEHLTAGGTVPMNGLVWADDYNDDTSDIDDPMAQPSEAKRSRHDNLSPFMESSSAYRYRKSSFSRRSPRDFRPRKVSISYRPIAPKPQRPPENSANIPSESISRTAQEISSRVGNPFLTNAVSSFQDLEFPVRALPRRRCFTFSQNQPRKPVRAVSPMSKSFLSNSCHRIATSSTENINTVTSTDKPTNADMVKTNLNEREVLVARRRRATFSARDLSTVARRPKAPVSPHPGRLEDTEQSSTESKETGNVIYDVNPGTNSDETTVSLSVFPASPRKRSSTFSVSARRQNSTISRGGMVGKPLPSRLFNIQHQGLFSHRENFESVASIPSRDDVGSLGDDGKPCLGPRFKPPLSAQFINDNDLKSMSIIRFTGTSRVSANTDSQFEQYDLRLKSPEIPPRCGLHSMPENADAFTGDIIKKVPVITVTAMEVNQEQNMSATDTCNPPVLKVPESHNTLDLRTNRRDTEHRQTPIINAHRTSPLNLSLQKYSERLFAMGDPKHSLPDTGSVCPSNPAPWANEEMRPRSWSMSSGISSLSLDGSRGVDTTVYGSEEDVWRPW